MGRTDEKLANLGQVLERQRVKAAHAVAADGQHILCHLLADLGEVAVAHATRIAFYDEMLKVGMRLSCDAGNGLTDGRFGFPSICNDGEFQRRGSR